MKVQVPFQQLINIVKSLTPSQKAKLREELDEERAIVKQEDDFIELLLNGPVYGEKELQIIEGNRKSIKQWQTKN